MSRQNSQHCKSIHDFHFVALVRLHRMTAQREQFPAYPSVELSTLISIAQHYHESPATAANIRDSVAGSVPLYPSTWSLILHQIVPCGVGINKYPTKCTDWKATASIKRLYPLPTCVVTCRRLRPVCYVVHLLYTQRPDLYTERDRERYKKYRVWN